MGITAKGQPGGLATLDANGHVPASQLQLPQAGAVEDVPELTAAPAAGDTPTAEEYDALLNDVTAMRATVNSLLAEFRAVELLAAG